MRGISHLFTSVSTESLVGSREYFSQVLGPNNFSVHAIGQASLNTKGARLNWLLSTRKADSDPLPELIDHMGHEAGIRGARFITAGAKVDDCLFETLRRSGYCIFGWESIWEIQVEKPFQPKDFDFFWRNATSKDIIELEKLQRKLLSPAVQSVTEFAGALLPDFIIEDGNRLLGYAYCSQFNSTVLIKPYFRLDLPQAAEAISLLIEEIFSHANSVLLVQTSDQCWMTESLHDIGRPVTPREELMVKHFAIMEKLPVSSLQEVRNGRQRDTVRPMMPSAPSGKNFTRERL